MLKMPPLLLLMSFCCCCCQFAAATATAKPSSLRRRHCRFRVAIAVSAVLSPLLPPIQFCASDFAVADVFPPPSLTSRCFRQANPSLCRLRFCPCRLAAISLPTSYHRKSKFILPPLLLSCCRLAAVLTLTCFCREAKLPPPMLLLLLSHCCCCYHLAATIDAVLPLQLMSI